MALQQNSRRCSPLATVVAIAALAIAIVPSAIPAAAAFQIKASVSVPQTSPLATDAVGDKHEGRDAEIERLVAEKLNRIAAEYQTHRDKMKRTLEMELELSAKVESCFMSGTCRHQKDDLLLSSKLNAKQRLLEQCTRANGQVVRNLLSTDGKQLFQSINFVPSAATGSNGEHDDLGQLMGNGGMMEGGEKTKESDGYDTALQVLHHTARDWTAGAAPCREATIGWIVSAIMQYASENARMRVLVPGAGLGRLAYDISTCSDLCQKGEVHVEANDSSVTMIFAAQQVLEMLQRQHDNQMKVQSDIFPFLSDPQINQIDTEKRFERDVFPDDEAFHSYERYWERKGEQPNLAFTVGDFVSTYSQQTKQSQYDVVATSFFIDTATNIYQYVFIMKHVLDSDGESPSIWVNCGPVQWHPCALLRPTVEELKGILEAAGFELLVWQIAHEAVAYRHPDDLGTSERQPRYTRSEGYRPLQFVARLRHSGAYADEIDTADLPLKIQYSEYLNEVASGKVKLEG
ncbi:hypothetical protein ACHAXT_002901 [Thalassiosira profunda]